MSFPNRVRAFRLLSWTLKKREDKSVQEKEVWDTSNCGGTWKQFVF